MLPFFFWTPAGPKITGVFVPARTLQKRRSPFGSVCVRSLAFAREFTATHSLRKAFSFVLRSLKDMSLYGSPSGAPCNTLRKQQQKALRNTPTSALYCNNRGHPFSRVVVRSSIKDILRENPLHSLQKSVFPSVAEFLPFVPRHAANISGQSGMQLLPLLPGAAARPLAPG